MAGKRQGVAATASGSDNTGRVSAARGGGGSWAGFRERGTG